jgi:hypothetical protein
MPRKTNEPYTEDIFFRKRSYDAVSLYLFYTERERKRERERQNGRVWGRTEKEWGEGEEGDCLCVV